MKRPLRVLTLGLLVGLVPPVLAETAPVPAATAQAADPIAASIGNPSRPAADRERDAARHPAEILAFTGVKPGDHVVDFLVGGGYFTRLFSGVVGPNGQVSAFAPKEAEGQHGIGPSTTKAVEGLENAKAVIEPALSPGLKDVDVFFTSQNYHDLHTALLPADITAFNKMVFDMLKPGGVYIVIDHAAKAGADVPTTADTLHRIDPAVVRKEVEAAGFVLDEESKVLANPSDTHDKVVFDPEIRGKTDQFIYRFRKPR